MIHRGLGDAVPSLFFLFCCFLVSVFGTVLEYQPVTALLMVNMVKIFEARM